MKLTRHTPVANSIGRVSADGIAVNGVHYTSSLIVSASAVIADWQHPPLAALDRAALAPALDQSPELLLIGCGNQQGFVPTALLADLAGAGIGIEVMTNDAACRTYNVLLGEDRKVVAALMLSALAR
ncbi:MAG: MTH938/NDUFAF3 family protein [Pseudomonadota bacterium]